MHFFSYTGIDIVSLRWSLLRIKSNDNRQRRLPMLALRIRGFRYTIRSREAFSRLDCLDAECPYCTSYFRRPSALDTVRRPLRSAILTILESQTP